MRHIFLLFLCLFFTFANAQKDTQYWYFGKNAGIKFFNKDHIVDTTGNVWNEEGVGTITLKNGAYFYSDGRSIYNKNHNKVNGITLEGESSSTQGILMLQHPENDSTLFIFTNSEHGWASCPSYYYSLKILSDTTLKLIKKELLQTFGSEKITSCFHRNHKDIWVISHSYYGATFIKYLITSKGIIKCVQPQDIGTNYITDGYATIGQSKFNTQATVLASTTWAALKLDLFKFDNLTGLLYDSISLDVLMNFGIEFSPSGEYLYVSDRLGKLSQFSLKYWNADSITNSRKTITTKGIKSISALQLAPDNKIYYSNYDSSYLACISYPNRPADSCAFTFRGINLQGRKCRAGLPTVNQSNFYTPPIDFSYNYECVTNTFYFFGKDTFNANTFNWRFKNLTGSGGSGFSFKQNPSDIIIANPGDYEIRFIASKGSRSDTIIKIITVYPKIEKTFLGKDTAYSQGSLFSKILKAPLNMHCYMWQDSSGLSTFVADTAGTFFCKIISPSFCEVIDTIVISECVNDLIAPSISQKKDTLFANQSSADSFVWFRNGQFHSISKQSFIVITDTGAYRVEAAKKGHCNRGSVTKYVYTLSLYDLALNDIKVYPNPSGGKVFIKCDQDFDLIVTDITGRNIANLQNPGELNLHKGIYLLNFRFANSNVVKKIVIF